jgi:hypothetical protein
MVYRCAGEIEMPPRVLKEIVDGMKLHEMDLELRRERGSLDMWNRSLLREKDLTDFVATDIG